MTEGRPDRSPCMHACRAPRALPDPPPRVLLRRARAELLLSLPLSLSPLPRPRSSGPGTARHSRTPPGTHLHVLRRLHRR
ncbi:hypothetical protein SCOCK_650022 [Actinacidiphila cocklensis]|uniref:Uncharacterized protein n=1 Tax=Actinacidiphila cocklensis TaxID=887465 RepID=A0A9W4DYF2_9ACTN|nr:hypothetical protein SCOCK_650022 [Actinacidiphila cocklensis]